VHLGGAFRLTRLGVTVDVIQRRVGEDWQALLARCENVERQGVDRR
jgi:hypothetical protein